MRRWIALAALLFVVFVGVGAASSTYATEMTEGPACRWTVVATKHRLWELTSTPQRHMWALGPGPIVERFDGRNWHVVPSPRVTAGRLFSVAAVSENYAWAVGSAAEGSLQPLIERWDGRRWRVVPGPRVIGGVLYGVAVASGSDAWAVGVVEGASREPLIVHWDGKRWTRVRSTLRGALYDVTASAPDSALAVGGEFVAAWDGRRWRQVPTPFKSDPESWGWWLNAVAGFSGRQAWAVGYQQVGHTIAFPIIERWNGSRFREVAGAGSALTAVAARSADDAWAVGLADPTYGGASIAHWNGRSWQDVATPPRSDDWFLDAVAVPKRGDVWTVGTRDPDLNVDGDETSLMAHLSCR